MRRCAQLLRHAGSTPLCRRRPVPHSGEENDAVEQLKRITRTRTRQWSEGDNLTTCNSLLAALPQLEAQGCNVGPRCYNLVVHYMLQHHRLLLAGDLLRAMKERGVPANGRTHELEGIWTAKKHGGAAAQAYIDSLPDKRATPLVYQAALDSLEPQESVKMLRAMEEQSMRPSIVHYNKVLKRVPMHVAAEVLQMMRQNNLVPDVDTYGSLISAAKDDVEQGEAIFTLMQKRGVRPKPRSFKVLMNVYKNKGDYKGAQQVMKRMSEAGYEADTYTYGILMKAALLATSESVVQEVERLYAEAELMGCFSQILAARLMEAYMEARERDKAEELLQRLGVEGVRIHPAIRSNYEELLRRCGVSGAAKEVCVP
eukprot:Rhum_TRINITY_DN18742_c0_g1::Rhum_TRINITY_DN18742_c0_g1_i1::g.168167::m.168167